MFVYLIIAIELAVLYVVFWIVFLREPRPREFRAGLWGSYFTPADRPSTKIAETEKSTPLIDEKQLDFYLPSTSPPRRLYITNKLRKLRRKKVLNRRSARSYLHCQICAQSGHSQYAHKRMSLAQQASRTAVDKFMLSLNRVLNKLSVKLP